MYAFVWYVYMYVCVRVCQYIHTDLYSIQPRRMPYIHTYICMICIYTIGTHTKLFVHVHTHTQTYIHTYIRKYIHAGNLVCIFTHTYIHTHTHVLGINKHTHIPTYAHTFMHAIQYLFLHLTNKNIYAYTYTCTYTYTHTRTHTCAQTYTLTIYVHTHTHTYTYTHIHVSGSEIAKKLVKSTQRIIRFAVKKSADTTKNYSSILAQMIRW
jgi:hypothetical protein